MKNNGVRILVGIVGVVLLVVNMFQCGGCSEDNSSQAYESSSFESTDYSWIYGTWVAYDNGDKHVVSFAENGVYIESFSSSYYGTSSGSGTFSISGGRIRLDSGDGYPAYMQIDEDRRQLRSDNIYYNKR